MDGIGILVQRSASVVGVTAAAYVWQLFQESGLLAFPEVFSMPLQNSLFSDGTAVSEFFWPPTKQSAPITTLVIFFFIVIVKRTFFTGQESEEKKRVREEKKRLLLAQMSMALRWSEDIEEKDSTDEAKDRKKEEPKKKRPPLAKDLFEMVYDDVEERHVTEYGIPADQEPYLSTLALFKERLAADFQDAVKFTNLARQQASASGVVKGQDLDADELKRVAEFLDGTKLTELLDLYQKDISKAFGKRVVSKDLVKAAEICKREVAMEQRKGKAMLLPILKPLMPLYFLATLLMIFDSCIGCVTHNSLVRWNCSWDHDDDRVEVDHCTGVSEARLVHFCTPGELGIHR